MKTGNVSRRKRPAAASSAKKKNRLTTFLLIVIMLVGAGIMAYPTVSDWWNSFHQSRAIATYVTEVENVDDGLAEEMIAAAQDYNRLILTKPNRFAMYDEDLALYESLLDLTGTGVMGYVQVPKIGVSLPVYHGTNEAVLQVAIGHLDWTSLPVGGESTHAVLSGHRGLPSAKLFTDLDKLETGDTFTITILKQTLTYEVDQIRIVLPEDISDLNIVDGQDYCTLVTCTPYGVNTHRLLVRGHRVETQAPEKQAVVTVGAIKIPNYISIPAIGIPMLFLFLVGLLIYDRVRKKPVADDSEADKLYENYRHQREDKPDE